MKANQSRGRDGPTDNNTCSVDELTQVFEYSPLDSNVDGIRLIVIEPNENCEAVVRCELRHVTFGERPKYEALSYMWGDESRKRAIIVDGKEFLVGLLLLGALQDLRYKGHERVVWVDAICINQRDTLERNRQLSIMPYIYERAKGVIVSLRRVVLGEDSKLTTEPLMKPGWYSIDTTWYLSNADYWRRVWIIQECSLARNLTVMTGAQTFTWAEFISQIKSSPELKDSIPMRLHRQIEQKYTDGHKLQTLLENYQNALCKDPRDKVYGFIGLASDTLEGFPMDYRKTLFEVWKDTMMFKNADIETSRHDIMRFGKLVRKTLGGKGIATEEEIRQDISLRLDAAAEIIDRNERPLWPTTISIPGLLIGRINYLGPSYVEIISDLKQTAVWRSNINKYIPEYERAHTRERSDVFLQDLEEMEDEDLRVIVDYDCGKMMSLISWKIDSKPESIVMVERNCSTQAFDSRSVGSPGVSRLFLLGGRSSSERPTINMGLAPSSARPGDFVCQIHALEKAVVVRYDPAAELLILVGTAALPRNRDEVVGVDERKLGRGTKFKTAFFDFIPDSENLDLFMDVAMAYQLLD